MTKATFIILCVLSLGVCKSYGEMQCSGVLGGSCPNIFSSSDKQFCCGDSNQYCCDVSQYLESAGNKVVLPIVLGVLGCIVVFICCICCACCSCCPCYRKRERGMIYAASGPSTVVQVNQNPANSPYTQPLYPAQPAMPQPPPSYTSEAYTKQSPYNPSYPNP